MPNFTPSQPYDDSFRRLAKLQGGDPAFFVLAVHSFIEGVLRSSCTLDDPADDRFSSFLDEFRTRLRSKTKEFIPGLDVLGLIRQQHFLTNDVRHRFAPATAEDARVATQHLRRFCDLAGIAEGECFRALLAYLKAWEDRRSYAELVKEVNDLGYRYQLEKKSSKEMTARVEELDAAQREIGILKESIRAKDRAITELAEAKDKKDARVDELRAERSTLANELRGAKDKAAAYEDAQAYIDTLSRMTVLTRTRADYEKSLIRLTPEQKKILEQIHLDSDFLVKGAAGTGKTLVLLKAIEKAKGRGAQAGFALDELTGSAALLTYTNTLVKYDRYIASILSGGNGADRIMTADSFIRERLAAIDPGATMDYDITKQLAERYAPEGIEAKDILAEAEGFIWANDVSYEEYALGMMERRGMKHPLLQEDRRKVWAACEAMAAEMAASRRYGKGYSRVRLIRHAESNRDDPALKVVDYVFVDEAQDLSASDLKALKACSRRALILAGDADQSIYQPGFSFRRAGIDISGRTRILKLNFRNTVAIHELAERFRAAVPGFDPDNEPAAFRDGAAPELFCAANRQELLDILVARVDLFVGRLGYDPDNVAVLVPLVDDIEFVRERLVSKGYEVADLRDKSFDFSSPGAVRVSTLHSAKGLDFPVVLLFLYRPPYFGSAFDEMTTDKMTRNLVYVAMTRAMDHLGIFTLEEPKSQALKDLRNAFELKPSSVS